MNTRERIERSYEGIDLFGIYCGELDRVFLVPVVDVGRTEVHLRIEPARNGQRKGIRIADPYELK